MYGTRSRIAKHFSAAVFPLPVTRKAATDDTFILYLLPVRSDVDIGTRVTCDVQALLVQLNNHMATNPCLEPVFSKTTKGL